MKTIMKDRNTTVHVPPQISCSFFRRELEISNCLHTFHRETDGVHSPLTWHAIFVCPEGVVTFSRLLDDYTLVMQVGHSSLQQREGKLNLKKFEFLTSDFGYFGHMIGEAEFQVESHTTNTVRWLESLKMVTNSRPISDLHNFYHILWRGLAKRLSPWMQKLKNANLRLSASW